MYPRVVSRCSSHAGKRAVLPTTLVRGNVTRPRNVDVRAFLLPTEAPPPVASQRIADTVAVPVRQAFISVASSSAPLPPLVLACPETRARLLKQFVAGQLCSQGNPQIIILRGPHGGTEQLYEDQSGDSLALLGADRGSSQGVARRINMPDGGCITMRPALTGRVSPRLVLKAKSGLSKPCSKP